MTEGRRSGLQRAGRERLGVMKRVNPPMSVAADAPPNPGEIVRVRSRRYLVEGVVAAPKPEDSTLVHLSCLNVSGP